MTWPNPNRLKGKDPIRSVRTGTAGFLTGFFSLFRGARVVYVEHRELGRIYLVPMVLAFLFVVGAWIFFFATVDDIVNWIWPEPARDAWWGLKHLLFDALALLLWVILAVATAFLAVLLFSILAAPFSDFLSEHVEGILGTWSARDFSFVFLLRDLGQTLRYELARLGLKLAWLAPLFVLSLVIPVVGHILYVGVGGYLLCRFTGMDYVDWCAARRGWSWDARLAFAKRHRFALAGLGAAVVLSFFVPLLFVLVWPAAVAGGTLLFTDLIRNERPGNLPSELIFENEEKKK